MTTKDTIIRLLREVEEGKYSNILLNQTFREKEFLPGERAFITEVFYGVLRRRLFLSEILARKTKTAPKDWIRLLLLISLYQLLYMRSDDKGVVWEAAELAKHKFGVPVGRFVNGVLRSFLREKETLPAEIRREREDIYYSCPLWIYEDIKRRAPADYGEILSRLKRIPRMSYRVNRLKYSAPEFERLLEQQQIPILRQIDDVYYVEGGGLLHSAEFAQGKITAQDAASYLAAKNLDPRGDDIVLDACSAPGGKLAVLAELMENRGEITALDIYPHKMKLLRETCALLGIRNATPVNLSAVKIPLQGKRFTKILCDVPCSGYGVISKKPESLYSKKKENMAQLPLLQYDILSACAEALSPGGTLLYSACTFLREENGDVIGKFFANHPDFHPESLMIPEGVSGLFDEYGGFTIDWREEFLDGFYFAKMIKRK
ncbi:MAG: 16S rRNA (cytosine(967)-C(5))-methyltransferase RsmB [Fusobacteriaceae bacterium]|jgi:16S rRNA (cytosine967-C5)-methyltransferase|nr:16S rRNA (cytosine(967)-C(5))-methyltransferase RsmB [Fusobacteriaceae bacterium]